MLEREIIQQRGFRNVGEPTPTGFQVAVRCPYYRGIWASLLEDVELTVDGERYGASAIRWTLGGQTYESERLFSTREVRWPFDEPALLTVTRPGGLEPGLHEVAVSVTWRWSYIPVEMQPTTCRAQRALVLVR
ncbi:MAG: DUF6379 domain-containing protein [Thermoleophilia bacterium]|nr:DUF6379 domain-containing protein [Gaiellaceae bacterium]MDW8337761.1 DUF6379 domain-containing protein [Thermoleophilia bacterium]